MYPIYKEYLFLALVSAISAWIIQSKRNMAVAGVILLLGSSIPIVYGIMGIQANQQLSLHGVVAVCKENCNSANGCEAQYTVAGKNYIASRDVNLNYSEDDKVLYLPSNPAVNRKTDSLSNLPYILFLVFGGVMLLVGLAIFIISMQKGPLVEGREY